MTRAKRMARKTSAKGASAAGTLPHASAIGRPYMAALELELSGVGADAAARSTHSGLDTV